MDWTSIGQGLATGLAAAVPLGVSIAWIIRRLFHLGRWKETLATKEDLNALRVATQKDIDDTRADVAELKSAVAGLTSTVEGLAVMVETTRSDVGRIVDHLLGSKQE